MFLYFRVTLLFVFTSLSYKAETLNPAASTEESPDAKVGIEAFFGDNNKIVFKKTQIN